jgi:hypothetical protein
MMLRAIDQLTALGMRPERLAGAVLMCPPEVCRNRGPGMGGRIAYCGEGSWASFVERGLE